MDDELKEALDFASSNTSLDQKVDATFTGTMALRKAALPIRNVILTIQPKSDQEQAIFGSYLRMSLWVDSLHRLNDKHDFQAVLHAARCLYEIWIDIVELKNDASHVEKFFDFNFVARYTAAKSRVKALDDCGITDASIEKMERPYLTKNETKYDQLCEKHWGRDKNGKIIRPSNWSGLDLASRAQRLGNDANIEYRAIYSKLCWYTHAGLAGFAGVSEAFFTAGFGYGHGLCQKFFLDATHIVANLFRVYEANRTLKTPIDEYMKETAKRLEQHIEKNLSTDVKA